MTQFKQCMPKPPTAKARSTMTHRGRFTTATARENWSTIAPAASQAVAMLAPNRLAIAGQVLRIAARRLLWFSSARTGLRFRCNGASRQTSKLRRPHESRPATKVGLRTRCQIGETDKILQLHDRG